MKGIAALRRFAREGGSSECCELCGAAIGERHDHLVAPGDGRLRCACLACGGRFAGGVGRLVRVVTRARQVEVSIDDQEWRALGLPVAVAFFRRSAAGELSAHFPGPAGITAAPVDGGAWAALCARHPALPEPEAEVEALLISRLPDAAGACLVSIDLVYQLAGMLRVRWRGISGGEEARAAVAAFFREVGP